MYYINIEGLKDEGILENIYGNIKHFKLEDRVFITYEIDTKNVGPELSKVLAQGFIVDLNKIDSLSIDDMEELVSELIGLNSNILVRSYEGENGDSIKLFKKISIEKELKYMELRSFDFDKELNLCDLGYIEYQIIKEIFEEPMDVKGFKAADFMIKLRIDKNGWVYDEKNSKILDLKTDEFIRILFLKPKDIILNKEIENLREVNNPFTFDFYNPFIFLFNTKNINKRIIDYKYRVFDLIKNLSPKDYPKVPNPIIDILNKNEFIRLKDSLSIIGIDQKIDEVS